jgi:hypothetical protein
MRNFRLTRQYDAITRLFSSIGYAESLDGLAATIKSIARHLCTDGWLLIAHWVEPSD